MKICLPCADRSLQNYQVIGTPVVLPPLDARPAFTRIGFSAAHIVNDPLAQVDPWSDCAIDWDRTLAYREYLWSLGLGVAEAMDTAQRGMGLSWERAKELIARSTSAARAHKGALLASGVGTDHLDAAANVTLDDVLRAYEEQIEAVESVGGKIVLMASRALVKAARGPDDYVKVYSRILDGVREPVIIHWLGEMFDPALRGYWGFEDHQAAMSIALDIIALHHTKIDGVKISLLSKELEIEMRRKLPRSVVMYTGDDFNYPDLIAGDEMGYSHALLGIFDAIAPAASLALGQLASGDEKGFAETLRPTTPLSRHIFKTPTMYYKTGVVFLAYLNGHQDHFTMVAGQQSARSLLHLSELFRLADQAHVFRDPDVAVHRMKAVLAIGGLA